MARLCHGAPVGATGGRVAAATERAHDAFVVRRRGRIGFGKKLGLIAFGIIAPVLLIEAGLRIRGRPVAPHPIYFTDAGLEVPLGEVIAYSGKMATSDFSADNGFTEPPYGLLLANLKLRWGYRPAPRWDYFDEHGCVRIDTNSLGLRDLEFDVQKAPNEYRVLALGDSMTYGMGVRLDLSWPQVLEARLREELARPVEVINAGFATAGSDPSSYHVWVRDNGIHFEPDLVLVGLCLNDIDVRIGMLTYRAVPLEPVLGGVSLALDHTVQLVRQYRARQRMTDFRSRIEEDSPMWRGTREGLLALRDALRPRGVPLVVCVFPMLSQLEPELYPLRPVHELVTSFCADNDIRTLDLLPAFLAYDGDEQDLWAHPSDQHANDVGHAIQARVIHEYLQRERLLR